MWDVTITDATEYDLMGKGLAGQDGQRLSALIKNLTPESEVCSLKIRVKLRAGVRSRMKF